jgi:hypothetical protein
VSSLLTQAVHRLASGGTPDDVRIVVGVIAISVLLAALLLREMARAQVSGERIRRIEALRFVTVPLTLIFVAVIVPRIAALLA